MRVLCRLDEDVDPAAHPLVQALESSGVDVEPFHLPHRAYLRERRHVAAWLRDFGADVLHTHGYHADVVGGLAARLASVPRVATAHGFTGGGWKNRLFELLQHWSYRSAAAVVAVSVPIAERLSKDAAVEPAVTQLRNAWARQGEGPDRAAARETLGLPADAAVVGWVGRMSREKGPDVVVEALCDEDTEHVTLCMVGEGPLRAQLAERTASGHGARVVWAGAMPDASRLFAAFDVLVLSSRSEGTPMVLFEAMDAGVPIVATCVGGVPDVVGSGEAILVPPENPTALRAAVLEVLADEEEAQRRAARATTRLEEVFGFEPWLAAHEAIYRRVAAIREESPG